MPVDHSGDAGSPFWTLTTPGGADSASVAVVSASSFLGPRVSSNSVYCSVSVRPEKLTPMSG